MELYGTSPNKGTVVIKTILYDIKQEPIFQTFSQTALTEQS